MPFLNADVLGDVAAFAAATYADLSSLRLVSVGCHAGVVGCFRAHAREEEARAALAGGYFDSPTCLSRLMAEQVAQYGCEADPDDELAAAARRLSPTAAMAAPHESAMRIAGGPQLRRRYNNDRRLLRLLIVNVIPYAFEFESGTTATVAEWLAILAQRAGSNAAWPPSLPWLTCIGSVGSLEGVGQPPRTTLSILQSMRRLHCPLGSLRFNSFDNAFDEAVALIEEWQPPLFELLLRDRRSTQNMARVVQLAAVLLPHAGGGSLRHYDGLMLRPSAAINPSLLDFKAVDLSHVSAAALASLVQLRALSLEVTDGSVAGIDALLKSLPPRVARLAVFDARDADDVAAEGEGFTLHRFLADGGTLPPMLVQIELGPAGDGDLHALAVTPQAAHLTCLQILSGTFTGDGLAVIGRSFPSLRHLFINDLDAHSGRASRTPYASIEAAFGEACKLRSLETLVLEGDAAPFDSDAESCDDAEDDHGSDDDARAPMMMMDTVLLAISRACPLLGELSLDSLYFADAAAAVRTAAPHLRCLERLTLNAFELRPRHAYAFTSAAASTVRHIVRALPALRAFTEVTSYRAPWAAAVQREMELSTGKPCVVR